MTIEKFYISGRGSLCVLQIFKTDDALEREFRGFSEPKTAIKSVKDLQIGGSVSFGEQPNMLYVRKA